MVLSAPLREAGGKNTREPRPMEHGTPVIVFVQDPDGYTLERVQEGSPSRG